MTTVWPFGALLLLMTAYSDIVCGELFSAKIHLKSGVFTCTTSLFSRTFTISKLCDSTQDCFWKHEKDRFDEKCTDDCLGKGCINGACLDHYCWCNKGYAPPNCEEPSEQTPKPVRQPCAPWPCGPNSQCEASADSGRSCSCLPGFVGSPPNCQLPCYTNDHCSLIRACQNSTCIDPCDEVRCGDNAYCEVQNHEAICSCEDSYAGDAYLECHKIETPTPVRQPCAPSLCGPNSRCDPLADSRQPCSCLPGYVGSPPRCQRSCDINNHCSLNRACKNSTCIDPCDEVRCGDNAYCDVQNHEAICSCEDSYAGDAYVACYKIETGNDNSDPWNTCSLSSGCGPNTVCRLQDGKIHCRCKHTYNGDPYDVSEGCRHECDDSSGCPDNRDCVNFKCSDRN